MNKNKNRPGFLFLIFFISLVYNSCTQNNSHSFRSSSKTAGIPIPRLEKQGTATKLIVDGKPFLLIAGELHNSTCGGFRSMRSVWEKLAEENLNTVIATVSWELIEPSQGEFDFSLVDSTILGARQSGLKLVLIWFGSWKNGSSAYAPSWVKKDYRTFPRVKDEHGKPLDILSTFGDRSRKADAEAFATLMRHIRDMDSAQHTVIMMQVENEMGIVDHQGKTPGNARRDFSEPANAAFHQPVPEKLMDYLNQHKESLYPELLKVWSENGYKTSGSWEDIFGKSLFRQDPGTWRFFSYYTEELFMAWNYASYVETVASAGKQAYPLPMYVNAWLKQPSTAWPGRYPSGGPLPQVLDIWRAGAPSIDFIAPDIYMDEFTWACDEFSRNGNPLFIPETRGGSLGAARAFYVFGQYDALCFSPFGIDGMHNMVIKPLSDSYAILQKLSPVILENQGKNTMRGILVDTRSPERRFKLGDYLITAIFADRDNRETSGGLIIRTRQNEYLCAGRALDIFFAVDNDSMRVGVNAVDEGTFENGKWIARSRLNGDETHQSTWDGSGLKLPADRVTIQKITLYQYK